MLTLKLRRTLSPPNVLFSGDCIVMVGGLVSAGGGPFSVPNNIFAFPTLKNKVPNTIENKSANASAIANATFFITAPNNYTLNSNLNWLV